MTKSASIRKYYHGLDFYPCMKAIDTQYKLNNSRNLKAAIDFVKHRFTNIGQEMMRKMFKLWKAYQQPTSLIYYDHRKTNHTFKALSSQGEIEVVRQILEMNRQQQQVTYNTVRNLSLKQRKIDYLLTNKEYQFTACDGWIRQFIQRHNLSSQLISKHSSSEVTSVKQSVILDYKKIYQQFLLENGTKHVYNFDETSFINCSGMRTISKKRTFEKNQQPHIKNSTKSNQRVSIGCTISLEGEKLLPILNVKGSTNRCFKKYQSNPSGQYLITSSPTSWFKEDTMYHVLKLIHHHADGHKALCIWDSYRPHRTNKVIEFARSLSIELLEVPRGLTGKYQPLDYQFNGVFKQLMKSYWFGHRYNESNPHETCHFMTDTIVNSYHSITSNVVISSFDCMKF